MEEKIERTIAFAKRSYLIFWLFPVLVILLGELDVISPDMDMSNATVIYWTETAVLLLTLGCVPVAWKLLSWALSKKIDYATLPVAMQLYLRWSITRLILLELPALSGCICYYLLLSDKCLLCSLIALTASLFCIPSEKRIRKDLKIDHQQP